MHYISPDAFGRAATTHLPLRQSHASSPRRSGTHVADGTFIDSILCSLVMPAQVFVDDVLTGRLCLAKIGFTVALPPKVALQWIRFMVRTSVVDGGVLNGKASRIVSIYPDRVTTDVIARGRIAVDANGELTQEQTVARERDEAAPKYQPRALGWRIGPAEAIWDWLPAAHVPPLGSDSLFLSVIYPANAALWCERSVQLAIRPHEQDDVIILEYSAESAQVEAATN